MSMSFLFSLFSCCHLVDGPGMICTLYWESFELSRCDSYSQYNFCFILEFVDNGYILKGECRDEEGNIYTSDNGIEISNTEIEKLRSRFELDKLPDVVTNENDNDANIDDEEVIILDAPTVDLVLKYPDGTQRKKTMTNELSIEIYEQLLPYFMNS